MKKLEKTKHLEKQKEVQPTEFDLACVKNYMFPRCWVRLFGEWLLALLGKAAT